MLLTKIKKILIISLTIITLGNSISFADMNIKRIAGENRADTAIKVNDEFIDYSYTNYAILSNGSDFRTSLYASYMASTFKAPLYLNGHHGITTKVLNDMKSKKVRKVFIIGGYNLMDKSIDNTLISKRIKFQRIYDKTVYDKYINANRVDKIDAEIDAILFNYFHPNEPRGDIGSCILINDKKFPDMLSIIPLASQLAIYDTTGLYDYKSMDSTDGYKFIIGGTNTVPSYFKTFLGNDEPGLNDHSEEDSDLHYYTGRIAGKDRYQTAIEIAKTYPYLLDFNSDTIILVNGKDYPDALASGIAAVRYKSAILLTQPKELNKDTERYIKDNNIKNIIIIGGEKSISKNIENQLNQL